MFEKILQESHFGEKPFLSYLHFMMCIVCTMLLIPTTLCTKNKITQKVLLWSYITNGSSNRENQRFTGNIPVWH